MHALLESLKFFYSEHDEQKLAYSEHYSQIGSHSNKSSL